MCPWHGSRSLKTSTWHTPTVMFLKPHYSSWEPSSRFAAMLGQLHWQKGAAAKPGSPHSLNTSSIWVLKCLVNVARGCGRSGPCLQYYTREKKGNPLGKPPKESLGIVKLCRDTNWVLQAWCLWLFPFPLSQSLSAVTQLRQLTSK